jgi:hypothetical protein
MFNRKAVAQALTLLVAFGMSAGVPASVSMAAENPACTIVGTAGDDVLTGTSGKDVICGLAGNDIIDGLGGNDVIYGGAGNDTIKGGSGNDLLFGDSGKDLIAGEAGRDTISGGAGNDMLSGGPNKDTITTNQGNDACQWDSSDVVKDTCKFDRTKPVVTASASANQSIEAGTTPNFTWKAADASGIDTSWISIGGPSGWITNWCEFIVTGQRVQGNAQKGAYSASCAIPKSAPNLTYTVFINSRDYMGNYATVKSFDFQVFGGTADAVAPTFDIVSAPTQVQPGATFEISWSSSDETDVAYSGVFWAYSDSNFSNGTVLYVAAADSPIATCSNSQNCSYVQTFLVNPDAPVSTYTLWATRADSLGNKAFDRTAVTIDIIR